MTSNPPPNPPKKYKFKPKLQTKPLPKPEVKSEEIEDADSARATELMRQFHERSLKTNSKVEKKIHASQIAFGLGAATPSLKTFGPAKLSNQRNGSSDNASTSAARVKEYEEPWDYYSNYPITLPLRRPYSGDPAILDEEEFGESTNEAAYDENRGTSASNLGLFEETIEPTMFFLQLPPTLPLQGSSATSIDHESGNASSKVKNESDTRFTNFQSGYLGKLLVYKSGAVKLKLGENLFDVSPGVETIFAQDVVAVNTSDKRFCVVGEIEKRAVITPDIDTLLGISE